MSAAKHKTVKKFISNMEGVVYYNDRIKAGKSLKIVYNTDFVDEAIKTYMTLRTKFPKNTVRFLGPTKVYRDGYTVRIWAEE